MKNQKIKGDKLNKKNDTSQTKDITQIMMGSLLLIIGIIIGIAISLNEHLL